MNRRYRKNLSWLILGKRINRAVDLHPILARKVAAARKRGLHWQAYRMVEEDKYRGRKPAGQWLWIPKARIIGHLELPAPGDTFVGGKQHSITWSRAHPLARNLKEVWFQHQWGHSRRGKMERWGPEDFGPTPYYEHWLEAREVAEREGRKMPPFKKWRARLGEEWHWTWYRGTRSARTPRPNAPRGWDNPKASRLAHRLTASLRKLRTRLKALVSRVQAAGSYGIGWDTVLDRTEAAILRCCPGMFGRELATINGLRRRYEGYIMPIYTAILPANMAIIKTERALGVRTRRPVRRWPRRR